RSRTVAGCDLNPAFCQKTRVYASSTSNFQDPISGTKCLRQFLPHRRTLSLPDLRRGEGLVVSSRDGIKWSNWGLLLSGGHSLNLYFRDRGLQARTRLGNSALQL